MLKTIGNFAALAVIAVGLTLGFSQVLKVSDAHAQAPLGRLTSNDAGNTNALTLPKQFLNIEVQCVEPSCLRLSTDAGIAVCTTDYQVPGLSQTGSTPHALWGGRSSNKTIATGAFTKIRALALDAGNPDCTVFQMLANP